MISVLLFTKICVNVITRQKNIVIMQKKMLTTSKRVDILKSIEAMDGF
jgi:hypothetical protein